MSNNSTQFFKKYELGKVLGTGAFSEVKLAINKQTKEKFAVKIIDKSKCKGNENMIDTEISILSKVHHENIVRLYDLYQIDNKIYLIMELVTGGELFDDIVRRGKYTESDAAKIVQKILLAIDYLHGMGIAHRDLKPENLLLSDKSKNGKVMISDFGLSKIFNDEEVMKTACGTPGYVAPEVLKRQGYGKEVDLWSIGVITYILLCGYPPFYDQNNVELYKQILACRYEFEKPWWDNISEDAKGFIRKLLVLDPAKRYTAKQAVMHPFIVLNCGPPPNTVEQIPKEISTSSTSFQKEGSNGKEISQTSAESNNLAPGVTKKLQQVLSTKNIKFSQSDEETLNEINNDNINSKSYNNNSKKPMESKNNSRISSTNANENKSLSKSSVQKKKDSQMSVKSHESNEAKEKSLNQILSSIPPVSPYFINGKKSIRILSFNIFLRPPGIKNHDSDYKSMRLAYFCEKVIHSYDIICLQEFFAYGTSRQTKFLSYAKNAGFEYSLTLNSKNLINTSIDSGLVIISRYPIIKSERLTFKRGIKTDRFYSKGALYAKILCSPNREINVFNTHLQSGISNNNNTDGVNLSDALVVTRCKQLMALKSFIDSCTEDNNDPILLAADMNVNSRRTFKNGNDSEEYVLMKKILAGEWVAVINHHDTTTVSTASKSQSGGMNCVNKVVGGNKKFTESVPRYKVTDLIYENYGKHPITKGDVESFETMKPTETVLTSTSSLWTCLSVDYLFWMEHKDNASSNVTNANPNNNQPCTMNDEKEKFTIAIEKTQVNKFLTPSREYTQLSDHYGLTSIINVN
jgi:serine/threonine protein kinase/endonuclease/exonuclease/phosphatase family metal-dependent hydrolase